MCSNIFEYLNREENVIELNKMKFKPAPSSRRSVSFHDIPIGYLTQDDIDVAMNALIIPDGSQVFACISDYNGKDFVTLTLLAGNKKFRSYLNENRRYGRIMVKSSSIEDAISELTYRINNIVHGYTHTMFEHKEDYIFVDISLNKVYLDYYMYSKRTNDCTEQLFNYHNR